MLSAAGGLADKNEHGEFVKPIEALRTPDSRLPLPGTARLSDAETIEALRSQIRGCPEPLVVAEAGRFISEWSESVAHAALRSFGDR
jgi:hypothetical protein